MGVQNNTTFSLLCLPKRQDDLSRPHLPRLPGDHMENMSPGAVNLIEPTPCGAASNSAVSCDRLFLLCMYVVTNMWATVTLEPKTERDLQTGRQFIYAFQEEKKNRWNRRDIRHYPWKGRKRHSASDSDSSLYIYAPRHFETMRPLCLAFLSLHVHIWAVF